MVALVSLTVGTKLGWWLHGRFAIEAESPDAPKPVVHVVAPSVSATSSPQRYLVELVDRGKVVGELGITKRTFRIYHPAGVAWDRIGKSPSGIDQYRRVR